MIIVSGFSTHQLKCASNIERGGGGFSFYGTVPKIEERIDVIREDNYYQELFYMIFEEASVPSGYS